MILKGDFLDNSFSIHKEKKQDIHNQSIFLHEITRTADRLIGGLNIHQKCSAEQNIPYIQRVQEQMQQESIELPRYKSVVLGKYNYTGHVYRH